MVPYAYGQDDGLVMAQVLSIACAIFTHGDADLDNLYKLRRVRAFPRVSALSQLGQYEV